MESYKDIWQQLLLLLEKELSSVSVNAWFHNCEIVELTSERITISADNAFCRDIIVNHYFEKLENALFILFSSHFQVEVISAEEAISRETEDRAKQDFCETHFTFERFVVGDSNRIAYSAAKAIVDAPGQNYNPLFIYGHSGLGKTHLLQAIAQEYRKKHHGSSIVYIKGEDFTNELIEAIQKKTNAEFREKYRKTDLLLVDDIQFIAGKTQTQEEFFHTFNTLYENGRQVVLSSDRTPKETSTLEQRLRSRFEMGLMVEIKPPEYETRFSIIKLQAQSMGIDLGAEIIEYIANCKTSNIRQLEGILKKVKIYHSLQGNTAVTLDLIRDISSEILGNDASAAPEDIIRYAASYYGVSPSDLIGKSRQHKIVVPRHVCMYLLRENTRLTQEEIGKLFGRHHTTVMSDIQKIRDAVNIDSELRKSIQDIITNFMSIGK